VDIISFTTIFKTNKKKKMTMFFVVSLHDSVAQAKKAAAANRVANSIVAINVCIKSLGMA